MIHPRSLLLTVIRPVLRQMPEAMESDEAEAMLIAISMQESGLRHRKQVGGPARGLWQFEPIGVRGVLDHPSSWDRAQDFCATWLYEIERQENGHATQGAVEAIYGAITDNDILACGFARLALWRLPDALVGPDKAEAAWGQYLESWRPGKPHRDRWSSNWSAAWQAVAQADD